MKTKVTLTIDREVLREIDQQRGMINRSAFCNKILKIGLKLDASTKRVQQEMEKSLIEQDFKTNQSNIFQNHKK